MWRDGIPMRPENGTGLKPRMAAHLPLCDPPMVRRSVDSRSSDGSATLSPMPDEPEYPGPFDDQLVDIQAAPTDEGRVELIVRRPAVDERELLEEAVLDRDVGLVGDRWAARDREKTPIYLSSQLTVISTRVLRAIEPDATRWPLAGDQLYVDLDLSEGNLPAGSRLAVGTSVIEISETPHTGCAKFSSRFGSEALRWINSPTGRAHRMRGLNARIVEPGTVRTGDAIRKVDEPGGTAGPRRAC